jgi:outer membrane protein
MQRISLVLNIFLVVAVIYLFVKVNNLNTSTAAGEQETDTSAMKAPVRIPDDGILRVAYVVNDSLEKYEWYIDRKAEFAMEEKKVKGILDAELKKAQNREKQIQADFKFMPLSEQEAAQKELMALQQKLSDLESKYFGDLQEKQMSLNKQLFDNVNNFITEYSKVNKWDYILSYSPGAQILFCNPAFDVTSDVVNGLNKEYREYKTRQK